MKKIYVLLVFAIPLFAFSQTKDYSRYNNSWRLGLNMGASWQTSDVRSQAGIAGGFTLEKGLFENSTNFFSLAIRGRYLAANTFGSGYSRNYGVKDNDALNGKYDATVNYADSVPAGRRYVYDNYKMTYGEGALELQLGFNRLRVQTHVILNIWGGVGITSYKVKTNLKDADGKLYDFSKVDSSGNATKSLSSLKSMYDHSYESDAYGSKGGNILTFSPSCGIGFGYQFSPVFSIIAQYKLTFPQGVNADLLDGKIAPNNDKIAGSKDYYHYAGINLLFTLRGKKHVKDTTRTAYTPAPVYTNTVIPSYTATPPTNSVVTNVPPPNNNPVPPVMDYNIPKPIVDFITPAVSSSTLSVQLYKITAQVLNVENASQIQVKLNAFTQNNFTFNPQTHIVEFVATLQEGVNFVKIKGTNLAGTDAKTVFLDYQKLQAAVQPQGNPPQVVVTSPASSPYNTTAPHYNLFGNVYEVPSAAYITVKVNGNVIPNISYNASTSHLIVPVDLVEGNNLVEIGATNAYGSDSKTTVIVYQRAQVKMPPPVISFIDPLQNPAVSPASSYLVKAQVLNISNQGQLTVSVNGQSAAFTYDNNLKQVSIPANLSIGYNAVAITASNSSGNDSKSVNINYKPRAVPGVPPQITFTQPVAGASTSAPMYVFRAVVQNVSSASQLAATLNGMPVTGFSLNGNSFEYNGALQPGANVMTLNATTPNGSDAKSAVVTQNLVRESMPPAVTISQPTGNPTVTSPAYTFVFTAMNVPKTQVMVKLNGSPVSAFSFNAGTGSFTANLQDGQNTLQVSASNSDGYDSKTETVIFKRERVVPVANNDDPVLPPALRFTNPPFSPYDGTAGNVFTYKADVLNITTRSQVQAVYNGSAVSNFTFDAAAHQITYTTTLSPGENTLSITVTNSAGSKQKSATLKVAAVPTGNPVLPGEPAKTDSVRVIRGNKSLGRP